MQVSAAGEQRALIQGRCALLAPIVIIHRHQTSQISSAMESPRDDEVELVYITPAQQYIV